MRGRGTVFGSGGASKSPKKDSRCAAARKILGGHAPLEKIETGTSQTG